MTGSEKWRAAYLRTLRGTQLATLSVQAMPNRTVAEQVARANAFIAALRVMRMGNWRPAFPYA